MRNFTKWFKRWVINNEYLHIAIGGFVVMALVFVAIYLFDITNVPTSFGWVSEADSKLWLDRLMAYTGTAAGAFVGFIATILAVRITIDNQEAARREDNAKAVLPLIKVSPRNKTYDYGMTACISKFVDKTKKGTATNGFSNGHPGLRLENVGQRELYGLQIIPIKNSFFDGPVEKSDIWPILYRGEAVNVGVLVKAIGAEPKILEVRFDTVFLSEQVEFILLYSDCYGNRYKQKMLADFSYDPQSAANKSLIFNMTEVESCRLVNAPERVVPR